MSSTLNKGAFTDDAVQKLLAGPFVLVAANGAIDPHTANRFLFTKAGVAAMTLAAPTAGVDDGLELQFISTTANAHTVTATGLFVDGAAHVNVATWSSNAGGQLSIVAYQGKWYVQNLQAVTMS